MYQGFFYVKPKTFFVSYNTSVLAFLLEDLLICLFSHLPFGLTGLLFMQRKHIHLQFTAITRLLNQRVSWLKSE